MMVRQSLLLRVLPLGFTVLALAAGCGKARDELQRVQRVVGTGAQAALSARPDERAMLPEVPAASQIPTPEVVGDGALRFTPDLNHQNITSARAPDGYVVSWTDAARSAVYVGLLDGRRHAQGQGTRLHSVTSDEETIAAPAVAVAGTGYAVAWADRDNGRIRFARLDARGALLDRVSIVHDGVDAPRAVALGWNGRDFGVAATLRTGVYFARVSSDGARVGDGLVIAEEDRVRSIEGVVWDGRAFGLSFTVQHADRVEQVRHRIGRGERHTAPVLLGARDATEPRA